MTVIPAIDIRAGRCVRLREGRADQETVFVLSVDQMNGTFTAKFTKPHVINAAKPAYTITIPGNPGPQPNFKLPTRGSSPLIPYWTVLN